LRGANLRDADLQDADLRSANLQGANLQGADLRSANLRSADLGSANLLHAYLQGADLRNAAMPTHHFQAAPGGIYWKGIGEDLINREYQYQLGLNVVENFNADQRETCSFPGLHFATETWVRRHWSDAKYICKVQIPDDAQINNPWATDGKASADKLIVLAVYDMRTGEDVTEQFQ